MADEPKTINLCQFFQRFPDEEAARKYFEQNRWAGEASCPHCGSLSVSAVKSHKPMPYRCRDCRQHFSVRTGTVLAESRLPLHKWLMAIYIMTAVRKGIPSTQMSRELSITQKSAWFLAQRIRETWLAGRGSGMGDRIQIDEAYISGRENNKHVNKKLRADHGSVGKIAVVSMRSETGEVPAAVVADTKASTLGAFSQAHANPDARVITDTHGGYAGLEAAGFRHVRINHSIGEYVCDMAHISGIESFWSFLKRRYIGVYRYMSAKHLHRYVNEYSFRRNTAKVGTMPFIDQTIARMIGKRFTYEGLIHA